MNSSRCFATVITRSYLADARALAKSIRRFHDDPIYVVCIDDPEGFFDPRGEQFVVLTLKDILPEEDQGILFYYTAFELCCALRAWLHRYILDHSTAAKWVFLDSDIVVTSSLDPLFDAIDSDTAGLLTPHCIKPAAENILEPVETSLLRFGIFNAGFLALGRCDAAVSFVGWFQARLRTLGFFMEHDVNCDQLWLNFVPQVFPSIKVWKHAGANVAYWNIHERVITEDNASFRVNGEPLLFMHFSRWNIDIPEDWSFGRPVAEGSDPAAVAALGRHYRDALVDCGYEQCRRWPYGYARFKNGRAITKRMRRAYYAACVAGRAPAGSPFEHPEWFPLWKYPPDMRAVMRRWTAPLRSLRRRLKRG